MRTKKRPHALAVVVLCLLTSVAAWGAPPSESSSILPSDLLQEALRWEVMGPGVNVPCEALVFILDGPADETRVEALIDAGYAVSGISGDYVSVFAPITLYIDEESGPDALTFVHSILPFTDNWHNLEWEGWTDELLLMCGEASSESTEDVAAGDTWDTVEYVFREALERHEGGEFLDAVALYEQALGILDQSVDLHPEGVIPDTLSSYVTASTLYNLSRCYGALGHRSGDEPIQYWRPSLLALKGSETALPTEPAIFSSGDHTSAREIEALQLFAEATKAEDRGQLLDALQLYQEALDIYRDIGHRISEADCLWALGNCYFALLEYERAIECYQEALGISAKSSYSDCLVGCSANLGNCYYSLSDFGSAMEWHRHALTSLSATDQASEEEEAVKKLHLCYEALARDCYGAYREFHAVVGRGSNRTPRERHIFREEDNIMSAEELAGLQLTRQAKNAQQEERFRDAIELYEQALLIYHDLSNVTATRIYPERRRNMEAGAAWCLVGLGNCHSALYEYGTAIALYEQSLDLATEIDSQPIQAACLGNLASQYDCLGDYDRATMYHQQALSLFREMADGSGEEVELMNLGHAYSSRGDYTVAREYFERGLEHWRGLLRQAFDALESIRTDPYVIALDPSRVDAAEYEYRRRREELLPHVTTCLSNIAKCCLGLSLYQQAIGHYNDSLETSLESGDRIGELGSLTGLGACYRTLGDYSQALDFYRQALALAEGVEISGLALPSHWGLGRTHREMQQLEAARIHYEEAIEIVESIRGNVQEDELRQTYMEGMRTLYEEYLELLLEMGQSEETVLVAERLRARTFLDSLYQLALAPEQLQLSEAGINRTDDDLLPVMDPEALAAAVSEAQESLLHNEAVLEYMVSNDGIYLWIVTSDQTLGPDFIPYEREQLMRDVVALRQEIEPQTREVDGEPELFFSDPTETLGQFYEVLLQPALEQLPETVDTLILIPSGPLWYVPFAALVMTDQPEIQVERIGLGSVVDHRPTVLIDQYTLAFLPSLASLPMLMEDDTAATSSYLALANPILSEEQQEIFRGNYLYDALERACRMFAAYVGGDETDVHVQADAQEALAINASTGQRVLMYACHGDFNPSVPLASRLLLSPSEGASTLSADERLLDGDYHAAEVLLTDHTGVDLVVLAACETLLPTLREIEGVLGLTLGPESDEALTYEQLELIVAGDEVVGLSRAFLSSGAHSVLGTLWQASPRAIEHLLVSLGEESQGGLTWAEALRQAQQALIANGNYDDVWFWAPYQLIGRWR